MRLISFRGRSDGRKLKNKPVVTGKTFIRKQQVEQYYTIIYTTLAGKPRVRTLYKSRMSFHGDKYIRSLGRSSIRSFLSVSN